jgi:alpha-glucosidase
MQHVGERPVDPLTLEVYLPTADGSSAFVLYEDDGETFDYERGAWCSTRYKCAVRPGAATRRVVLTIGARVEGELGYVPAPRSYEVRFHGCSGTLEQVALDGVPLQRCAASTDLAGRDGVWALDEPSQVVIVRVADTGHERVITLGRPTGRRKPRSCH